MVINAVRRRTFSTLSGPFRIIVNWLCTLAIYIGFEWAISGARAPNEGVFVQTRPVRSKWNDVRNLSHSFVVVQVFGGQCSIVWGGGISRTQKISCNLAEVLAFACIRSHLPSEFRSGEKNGLSPGHKHICRYGQWKYTHTFFKRRSGCFGFLRLFER